jgi:hypothetical protein
MSHLISNPYSYIGYSQGDLAWRPPIEQTACW